MNITLDIHYISIIKKKKKLSGRYVKTFIWVKSHTFTKRNRNTDVSMIGNSRY